MVESLPVTLVENLHSISQKLVFPTPSDDVLNVGIPIVKYEIYNSYGSMVAVGNSRRIDVRGIVNGVYCVRLTGIDNMSYIQQVVVNH